jgi:alpha-galactosidase/6-phospho-beta-glucosidase family protein
MWINEYLYYFYYAERALDRVSREPLTRGEEVLALNRRLLEQLDDVGVTVNPEKAFSVYYNYHLRRNSTYMHYARPGTPSPEEADRAALQVIDFGDASAEGEGYAGVALDIMLGLEGDEPVYTALNVPNDGAIEGMASGDVVEVSCRVDRTGVKALPIGPIPEHQELLMRTVKQYEKLTVRAIREKSRQAAVMALMAHPLVVSYSRAAALVDDYLDAYRPYVAPWHPA